MSILTPSAHLAPSATEALITAATGSTTSGIVTIGLYQMLLLQVSGVWTGAVAIDGRIDGGNWVEIPAVDSNGVAVLQISSSGLYYVPLSGMTTYRVRAVPTSGSVTVTGKMTDGSAPRVPTELSPSTTHALIASASSSTTSSNVTVGRYRTAILHVIGTFVGTVAIDGRIDTGDWVELGSTDSAGILYASIAGMTTFRVRAAPTSGSVTVNARMSTADSPKPVPLVVPSATLSLITAAAANTTSNIVTIGLYEMMTFQVSGAWMGYAIVEARIGGGDFTQIPVMDTMGIALSRITGNGLFTVSLSGPTTLRVRVFPTSGTITVTGRMTMGPAPRVEHRRVNNRVAESYQTTIAAGANTTIFSAVDVSGYPLIAFGFRCPDSEIAGGAFPVVLRYAPAFNRNPNASAYNGTPESYIDMIDTTAGRGQSDYIFNRGELATVNILNNDVDSHNFDVWILGLR